MCSLIGYVSLVSDATHGSFITNSLTSSGSRNLRTGGGGGGGGGRYNFLGLEIVVMPLYIYPLLCSESRE